MEILYGFLSGLIMLTPIFLFGFLIALLNRRFYRLAGKHSKKLCYATGIIGTPIHELSHASMCLLFGHKIKEIKLFQIDSDDGTLGYVRHSFNKRNFYHRIGNFFIGIAPIVIGSLFLVALMFLMVNPMFKEIAGHAVAFSGIVSGDTGATEAGLAFLSIFTTFFMHAGNILWWIYFIIAAAIALHMNLSKADITGSKEGILFFIGFLLILCVILWVAAEPALLAVQNIFFLTAIFLSLILFQSFFLSAIWVLFALLFCLPGLIKRKTRQSKLKKRRKITPTKDVSKTRELPHSKILPNKDDPQYKRK